MRILLVNWQDRLNPMAGGAETHLHEIFGRLVSAGHTVTLLASGWSGAAAREVVDGIDVRRVGSRYSFGLHAPRAGRRILERDVVDVVVEAVNKVPVFSPAWSTRPVVLLVHHLFGTSAFQEAALPVATATWLLERPLPRLYRGLPVQVISRSTADDLVARGLERRDIIVINPGLDLDFFTPSTMDPRSECPTFVYVGRLRRYKRVDLIVKALAILGEDTGGARLVIAGRGEWEPHLRRLAARLRVDDRVSFRGFVSEEHKRDLFRSAWANVFVSPKEGWGITNMEAAACGTPTIASDSPGLRDSVVDGRTGILVPHGNLDALAAAMGQFAKDRGRVEAFGQYAAEFAQDFSWNAAAAATERHLSAVIGHSAGDARCTISARRQP